MDPAALLRDNAAVIDSATSTTARRRLLSAAKGDQFAAFVRARLTEDDYLLIRQYQGRSSFWTYLAIVVEQLSFDFVRGQWRPTAAARELGPVAVLLERLILRDRHSLSEAVHMARREHGVGKPDAELIRLWMSLRLEKSQGEPPLDS